MQASPGLSSGVVDTLKYPTTHHRLVGVVFPLTVLRMTVVSLCMHQKSLIDCLQQEHSIPESLLVSSSANEQYSHACVTDAQNPAESWCTLEVDVLLNSPVPK